MNRLSFLKKLGIGTTGIVIAPMINGVTYKNKKSPLKVTAINPKGNYTEGLVVAPPLHPCLGDHCVDRKGREWYIKNKENRHGYGLPDRTMLVLAPLSNPKYIEVDAMTNMRFPRPVPIRQRVSIHEFNRKFTITKRRNEHIRS